MKGLTMAQWINLKWNNRSVSVSILCIVRKNWPYSPTASGSMAGRQAGGWVGGWTGWQGGRQAGMEAGKIWVGLENFKILCRLNYSGFYFI